MQLVTRPALESDKSFILSSWLRSYRHCPDSNLADVFFFGAYRPIAEYLLAKCTVEVVTPEGKDDLILGYAVYEPGVVHWVYVKKDFRKNGIAKMLILKAGQNPAFTFSTPLGRKRLGNKYKPRLLRSKLNSFMNKE